jgi:uncharacterized protein YegP (UPF0339 family)
MKRPLRSLALALTLAVGRAAPLAAAALAVSACVADATTDSDALDATSATGRFETFQADDGLYYFQLLASNGERLMRSDSYKSLASAKKGVASAQKYGVSADRFEVLETDADEAYFTLRATNGQLLALSDTYSSKSAAQRGVDAVVKSVKNAATEAALASGARFETFKGADGKTYFRLRAQNGQIVLQSQGYSSKSAADGGIASVKLNGQDASQFTIAEGADGQHYFRLLAANGQLIGRSEMYATKSGAIHAAGAVRAILRELAGAAEITDATIQAEIEKAVDGLWYMSESDYPFAYVEGDLAAGAPITEAVVRAELGSYVDADADADRPIKDLVSMTATWQSWKDDQHNCSDPDDEGMVALCAKMRGLEQVLESNLTDLQVFYFGAKGTPGHVTGIGVSIFLVGRSPSGSLVGVRTLAIWT